MLINLDTQKGGGEIIDLIRESTIPYMSTHA